MIQDVKDNSGCSIRRVCQTLGLARSSFYHAARPTPCQVEDQRVGDVIEDIFLAHRKRYGYRRVRSELNDRGIVCSGCRVRRIMKQRGLQAIQPKRFVPHTSDGRADKPSPNRLAHSPLPQKPNEVWVSDITSIPTSSGWMYLALIVDLCSRKIIGWSLKDHMRSELVLDALNQALQTRSPTAGHTILHSDRGSQYSGTLFRDALAGAGLLQSMSARANPYDNAWSESLIGTLKRELLGGGVFHDSSDAIIALFEYIEGYYNSRRKHSSLGYKNPNQFERDFLTRK